MTFHRKLFSGKKFRITLCILIFLFSMEIFAIGDYQPGSELYVIAERGLNLRDNASPSGKKLILIPFGAKVKVGVRLTENPMTADGISGYWAEITYNKKTGFAFDGYLSEFKAPPKGCKSFKDYLTKTFGKGKEETVPAGDYEGRSAIRFGSNILYLTEGGSTWDLYFPGISMEELFLIGRACKEVQSKTLKLEPSGEFGEGFGMLMNSMYKDENGVVIFRRTP